MCRCWSVLCEGFSVCYVRDVVCVMCNLQPRPSSLRPEHASLRWYGGLSWSSPVGPLGYTTLYTSLCHIEHDNVFIACRLFPKRQYEINYTYMNMFFRLSACIHISIYIYVYIHIYICIYIFMYTWVRMYNASIDLWGMCARVRACMRACVIFRGNWVWISSRHDSVLQNQKARLAYMYIHTYIYIYTYMYIHVYTHADL